ncbi:MAG: hypothetical protein M1480_14510 [Bacteroidetes bacterium]|nr:hypothetical protein [Bacteroidota bacterium]
MYVNVNAKQLVGMMLVIFSIFIVNGCKSDMQITSPGTTTGGQTAKNSIISGQVINSTTGIPVDSALVLVVGQSSGQQIYQTALTDVQGKYSVTVQLTLNTNLTIYVSKSGFVQDTTPISVTYGIDYSVSLISLVSSGSTQKPSGNPVSIYLISQSTNSIGVQGSGSVETATLTFIAVDSSGTPIDLNHSVNVSFSFGAQPGGGEVLTPGLVQTNDQGQASVNITSGTKAGVVQVYASITMGTKTIYSQPVALSIFGGLPDLNHFSVFPKFFNVAYRDTLYKEFVNIFVGDKYANPVRPQTVVYLTSTGGYVQGSILTDAMGTAKADFVVGNPFPNDPIYGQGYAVITATTADENKQYISRSNLVLFSLQPQIIVNPETINIPNGGSQLFNYSVSDVNLNPLAEGTNISVKVLSGSNVAVQGDTLITLPDTQDKSFTHFQFSAFDTNDTVNVESPVAIKISVSGPNGSITKVISGTSH